MPSSRRQQMREFEDRALKSMDELFRNPPTQADVAAEQRRMLAAFTQQAPPVMQEVYREVARTSAGKADAVLVAELLQAFRARGIDDVTLGEHSVPVLRALADLPA